MTVKPGFGEKGPTTMEKPSSYKTELTVLRNYFWILLILWTVLGGTKRKDVFMDVENGKIFYVEGESGEKLLWETVRRSEK